MTEPDVASSDARNLRTRLTKVTAAEGGGGGGAGGGGGGGARYVLNGRKWWSTGAMDPRCGFALVVAEVVEDRAGRPPPSKEEEEEEGHSGGRRRGGDQTVVIVPMSHPGVRCVRPLTVFGYDDAPHGHAEVSLVDVELDGSAVILGEGRGFEISQSRLGPGRIHHCEFSDCLGGSRLFECFSSSRVRYRPFDVTHLLPFAYSFVYVGMRAVGLGKNLRSHIIVGPPFPFHAWVVRLMSTQIS